MSATSTRSPTSPFERRDIRSDSLPSKRDKEQAQKWSHGHRPMAGTQIPFDPELDGTEQALPFPKDKVRPMKQFSSIMHKSHANKNPKPNGNYSPRAAHKVSAVVESNDHTASPLSKSLLELLPQHINNTNSPIHTLIRTNSTSDAEILYSFDNKGPSPGNKGRTVDLGGLVELAEQKWASEQTERIVKGEYEVLDNAGEKTVLPKGKKRGSPKQRATPVVVKSVVDEDDGFELI
ncbi:hypothetical protein L207DRAFT_577486 [Hyaloscypha variabilis F]|uniref:Uncharacterized protein n=1 Tax=Hyaloscypha variabilis (strain UAMH 11265 / GT02V1 / F) TaxID=1149755 RepID=A0A2J6S791_HYAVF|nr:hypothetical protein L207DRAFT_577486 [Hyaloscypha variabilis F]